MLEAKGKASRHPTFANLQVGISDVVSFSADAYRVHDPELSPSPAVLEKDMDRWNARAVDRVVLSQKEHHKLERLLRVALHVLAYADWFTSALFAASPLMEAEFPNRAGLMERLSQSVNKAHLDGVALLSAALAQVVVARRCSVLQGLVIGEPYQSTLLTAPLTGPSLFGGLLAKTQTKMSEDRVTVSSAHRKGKSRKGRNGKSNTTAKAAVPAPAELPLAPFARGGRQPARGRGRGKRGGRGRGKTTSERGGKGT